MLNGDKRIHILLEKIYGALAERFMQRTFNPYKVGSIPTGTTNFNIHSSPLDLYQ